MQKWIWGPPLFADLHLDRSYSGPLARSLTWHGLEASVFNNKNAGYFFTIYLYSFGNHSRAFALSYDTKFKFKLVIVCIVNVPGTKFFYYFIIFIANLDPALETFLGVTVRDVDRGLRRGSATDRSIRRRSRVKP